MFRKRCSIVYWIGSIEDPIITVVSAFIGVHLRLNMIQLLMNLFRNRQHLPLGTRAENLAAQYTRKTLRFKLLTRNIRCPGGELDIIALDGDDLVFIEVRSLSSEDFQSPEASIRHTKRKRLRTAAHWFIRSRRLQRFRPRFDIIAIVWPLEGQPQIRHHRSAFALND